jgi:hypothetical protein
LCEAVPAHGSQKAQFNALNQDSNVASALQALHARITPKAFGTIAESITLLCSVESNRLALDNRLHASQHHELDAHLEKVVTLVTKLYQGCGKPSLWFES